MGTRGVYDFLEQGFHGRCRQHFVFQPCRWSGHDDGLAEIDACLFHFMMIFISEILIYIEAECIGFLHLGDLGERVGEHVVLLNPVSGSRRMIVHPMGEANPGVPLFGADSERGAETGEDREPEGLEGGPHVDDHVVAGAMDRFPHFFDIASEMAVLIIVECDATVHIGMAGIKGVMVHACLAEDLTVEVIGAALADGLLDVG